MGQVGYKAKRLQPKKSPSALSRFPIWHYTALVLPLQLTLFCIVSNFIDRKYSQPLKGSVLGSQLYFLDLPMGIFIIGTSYFWCW